jgi:hypothetical protein
MRRFGREPIANAVRGFFRTLCADFRRLSPFRSSIEILLPKPTSKKVPIYGASWSERRDLRWRARTIGFVGENQISRLTCVRVLCMALKSFFNLHRPVVGLSAVDVRTVFRIR